MQRRHGFIAARIRRRRAIDAEPLRVVREKENGMTHHKNNLIHDLGRFVVGLGLGLALTSAYVVVTAVPDLLAPVPPVEAVRLDPVVVTISAERFDALRAEMAGADAARRAAMADAATGAAPPVERPPAKLHVFGRGPRQG